MRLEVETALGDPDVTVIPLLVGGGRMPRADELPESVRPLSRRNALELSDLRWRHDVGRLVGTLGELLDAQGPSASTTRWGWWANTTGSTRQKDLDGLRELLDPAVVLKKGSSLELRGADEVSEEYRREFQSFGDQDPVLEWQDENTDANEELFEVIGQYLISVCDERRDIGRFGFLMRSVGPELLITQICLGCPDLRGSGRLLGG